MASLEGEGDCHELQLVHGIPDFKLEAYTMLNHSGLDGHWRSGADTLELSLPRRMDESLGVLLHGLYIHHEFVSH